MRYIADNKDFGANLLCNMVNCTFNGTYINCNSFVMFTFLGIFFINFNNGNLEDSFLNRNLTWM